MLDRAGVSYVPCNLKGWVFTFAYLAVVGPIIVVPQTVFPGSGIVSGYQLVTFMLFWLAGLRFAKRRSG